MPKPAGKTQWQILTAALIIHITRLNNDQPTKAIIHVQVASPDLNLTCEWCQCAAFQGFFATYGFIEEVQDVCCTELRLGTEFWSAGSFQPLSWLSLQAGTMGWARPVLRSELGKGLNQAAAWDVCNFCSRDPEIPHFRDWWQPIGAIVGVIVGEGNSSIVSITSPQSLRRLMSNFRTEALLTSTE